MYLPCLLLRPRRRLDRADGAILAALFGGSLALYTATLTRGLSSISTDSNELVTKSALLQVAHPPGAPLYIWLGNLFSLLPVGQVATRVTWMSALLAAVAVAALYGITARFVTGDRLAAAGTAALFALSLTFWSQAVIAELYAPNLGLLALVVWCLLEWAARRSAGKSARRWLLAAGGLFGAALGIHLSDTMFIPVFGIFLLLGWPRAGGRALDWRGGLAAGALAALALLPYAWQYVAVADFPLGEGRPDAAAGWPLFYEFTLNAFATWRFGVPPPAWPDRTVLLLYLLVRNLGWLLIPPLGAGLVRLLTTYPRLFYLFGGLALANFVFYATYRAPDIDVFFLPGFWTLMPFIALGLAWGRDALAGRQRPANASRLATTALLGLVIVAGAGQGAANFAVNDQAADVAFRDFYGNAFATLPRDAWVFHHGAALGYDLLYYTRLHRVRPDLHVVVGMQPGEPATPPWPPGPAYAGVLKNDFFLPAFLWDPTGANLKWYTPELFGMFRWTGIVRTGWLTLYRLSPRAAPPADWLLPVDAPAARPATRLDLAVTPDLTLLGVDLPPTAVPGRPLRIVRYWQARTLTLPRLATRLGDPGAVEVHTPLLEQLPDYLAARGLAPAHLPDYVIRDEFRVVVPSNTPPGAYPVTVATIARRLLFILVDPAPPAALLPQEWPLGIVQIAPGPPGPPPDPLTLTMPGPLSP